jgi:autotransporter-associated beta strand protein
MKKLMHVVGMFTAMVVSAGVARAAEYTWTPTTAATYSWDDATSNWTSGFPNAVGDIANLNINITGNQTINLNQAITVGTLNLGDTVGATYNTTTIAAGTAGSLIMDVASGSATISKSTVGNNVTDTISANIQLNDNLIVNNAATSTSGLLVLSGIISESGGAKTLTKTGAGIVQLSGANSYTGLTTISQGTLQLFSNTGSLNSASGLTFNGLGGTFNMDNNGAGGARSQSMGALTFSAGDGTVLQTRTATQNQLLTFSSLSARASGATGLLQRRHTGRVQRRRPHRAGRRVH